MKQYVQAILLMSAGLILLSGQAHAQSLPSAVAEEETPIFNFPRQIGNVWTYSYPTSACLYKSCAKFRMEIVDEVEIDGMSCSVFKRTRREFNDNLYSSTMTWCFDDNKIYWPRTDIDPDTNLVDLVADFGQEPGAKWLLSNSIEPNSDLFIVRSLDRIYGSGPSYSFDTYATDNLETLEFTVGVKFAALDRNLLGLWMEFVNDVGLTYFNHSMDGSGGDSMKGRYTDGVLVGDTTFFYQPPHDVYDLRPGVERYYTDCIPIPGVLTCSQSYYSYRLDRVIAYKQIENREYSEIERLIISNEGLIQRRDTVYQRVDGNSLLQWHNDRFGSYGKEIYRFNFELGDSVKLYYTNLQNTEGPQIENLSVVTADTSVNFPDGNSYRIVYGSDASYPWNNAQLINKLSDDWLNTVILQGTLGSNEAGLSWLVPFANMRESSGIEPEFFVGIHTFYHVSRFGPILSKTSDGLSFMVGFKSHDGQVYGYMHDGIPVGIDSDGNDDVVEFELLGNYPNPFNPTTQIRFTLPMDSQVELGVYTVTGQRIATLVNEVRVAGTHQVLFDASDLASGVYIYRIRAGDFMQTSKMTLVK